MSNEELSASIAIIQEQLESGERTLLLGRCASSNPFLIATLAYTLFGILVGCFLSLAIMQNSYSWQNIIGLVVASVILGLFGFLKGLKKREPILKGFCALTNYRLLLLEDNGNVEVLVNKEKVERIEGSSDCVTLIIQLEEPNATEADIRLGNAHRSRRLQVTQMRGLLEFDGGTSR